MTRVRRRVRSMYVDHVCHRYGSDRQVAMSSENHGEWPSVRDSDTTACHEPLHGGHRIGAFTGSPHTIGPQAIGSALEIAEGGIVAIFSHHGIDVSAEFTPVWEAFTAAMYVSDEEPGK